MAKKKGKTTESSQITGWQAIGKYLGQPVTVAQRWAKDGMPVQRKGRSMTTNPEELSKWLGRESGAVAVDRVELLCQSVSAFESIASAHCGNLFVR